MMKQKILQARDSRKKKRKKWIENSLRSLWEIKHTYMYVHTHTCVLN
jgi:hypothetical protein